MDDGSVLFGTVDESKDKGVVVGTKGTVYTLRIADFVVLEAHILNLPHFVLSKEIL